MNKFHRPIIFPMKKTVILCSLIALSLNIMAQINLDEGRWQCVLDEQFDEGSSYWNWDTKRFLNSGDYSWTGHMGTIAPSGEHQIYQLGNCQISTIDNTMHLVAYYDSACIHSNNYSLPKWMLPSNGGKGYPDSEGRLYFSGAMQYYKQRYVKNEDERKFLYGYFEIRCKLPVHQGAFPAFWLQSASKTPGSMFYEEIDIFEYSWWITSPSGPNKATPGLGSKRCYSCGLYYNNKDYSHRDNGYARTFLIIPISSSDLDEYHTYGCEWMPDRVVWYFDGKVVNEYYDKDNIPHRPMYLNVNYAIDNYYRHGGTTWTGPGEMVIDYIKVYQPRKIQPKRK